MKYLLSFAIVLTLSFIQGCSSSSSSSKNDSVRIGYVSKENVIPAAWEFAFESDEELQSFQWQFSDENFANRSSGQVRQVKHTFSTSGVHKVRLRYTTVDGATGVAENEVIIQSGSISGEIFAALNTLVDVDTRDPNEPDLNNNSFEDAQALTASSRIAGIVDRNDTVDFYQVQLQRDQSINLQVADQFFNQFESIQLQVFTSDKIENDDDIFTATTDSNSGNLSLPFVAPEDNSYFIKLKAINPRIFGANTHSHGIYSLQVEAAINTADFVAGELVVMMKEQRQYQAQGVSSKKDLGRIKALSLTNARQFMASKNITVNDQLDTNSHWQTLQAARLLSRQDDILYAEPNWKRYPSALAEVTDPLFSAQWHYSAINLEEAWETAGSRGSSSVLVAVLDTGVLTSHPDLSGNLVAGYDFIDGDANANDPGDKGISGQRSSFHGTHVAGTVAAIEGDGIGGTGVAPGVKIMPVRVLGEDGGDTISLISGLCFSAQLNDSSNAICESVPSGETADVINLSLGGGNFSASEQAVFNEISKKGIIVIAAAGNESTSVPSYPAAYDNVISVSATNRKTELSSYSNFGTTIDVAAPGGDFSADLGVLSTWGDDSNGSARLTYNYLQGTSMASPHVAGVAALMKSINPELDHAEFRGLLISGALTQDIGEPGRDNEFGYGLIDAQKSVLELLASAGPKVLSSTTNLFFDVSQTSRSFTLSGSGISDVNELGNIRVQVIGADNGNGGLWLSLNSSLGLGDYVATVSRGEMDEGIYDAQILVSSDAEGVDDVLIEVVLQIGNAELSANAGIQYVLVLDADVVADNDGVLSSAAGSSALLANDGKYTYQISGLSKGSYTLSTGSDLDLDNVICDAGESCGQYPTLSQPRILTISEDSIDLNIDMTVNYLTTSIGASTLGLIDYNKPVAISRVITGNVNNETVNNKADKVKQGN